MYGVIYSDWECLEACVTVLRTAIPHKIGVLWNRTGEFCINKADEDYLMHSLCMGIGKLSTRQKAVISVIWLTTSFTTHLLTRSELFNVHTRSGCFLVQICIAERDLLGTLILKGGISWKQWYQKGGSWENWYQNEGSLWNTDTTTEAPIKCKLMSSLLPFGSELWGFWLQQRTDALVQAMCLIW